MYKIDSDGYYEKRGSIFYKLDYRYLTVLVLSEDIEVIMRLLLGFLIWQRREKISMKELLYGKFVF